MELKIVSFNIRYTDDPNGHSIAERAPRIKDTVLSKDPDLIGFQECRPKWWPYIRDAFLDKYDIFNIYRAFDEMESSPILWKKDKFELVDKGHFWFSDTPDVSSKGWDKTGCYRMCIWVNLKEKATGEIVTYFNTHFGFGDKCQVDSAELIKKVNDEVSTYPTFVTADFNMCRESLGFKTMEKYYKDVNKATLNYTSYTYHGYDEVRAKEMLEKRGYGPIDHCFINDKFEPKKYEVLTNTYDGKYASDHFCTYIELETK